MLKGVLGICLLSWFPRGTCGKTMDFRVTCDMYHMTVVIFSTLANGRTNQVCEPTATERPSSAFWAPPTQTLSLAIFKAVIHYKHLSCSVSFTLTLNPPCKKISCSDWFCTPESQKTHTVKPGKLRMWSTPNISSTFCVRMPSLPSYSRSVCEGYLWVCGRSTCLLSLWI